MMEENTMEEIPFELGPESPEDKMVGSLEKIATYLDRVITVGYWCAGLLAALVFLLTLRLMLGK